MQTLTTTEKETYSLTPAGLAALDAAEGAVIAPTEAGDERGVGSAASAPFCPDTTEKPAILSASNQGDNPMNSISNSETFSLALTTLEECALREASIDEGKDRAGYYAAQAATGAARGALGAIVDAWTAQRVADAVAAR